MSHVPHELHEEFPGKTVLLRELRLSDAHFARIAGDYADVNHAIWRAEAEIEPTSDDILEELKKKRLFLKDQIASYLA